MEVVWTSTSTVYTRVPKTEVVYTTEIATEYESTNVYETVCYLFVFFVTESSFSPINVLLTNQPRPPS